MQDNFKAKISRGATVITEGQVLAPPSCTFVGKTFVGAFSYFGDGCIIGSSRIGRFCSFASSIKVGLGEHPIDRLSSHPVFFGAKNGFDVPDGLGVVRDMGNPRYAAPLIGHDVWVGANAIIARGVKVGTGAVIGAGAVVVKDVPAYAIVGGVPAKILKMRFNNTIIEGLLASQWWNLPITAFVGIDISKVDELVAVIEGIRKRVEEKGGEAKYSLIRHLG